MWACDSYVDTLMMHSVWMNSVPKRWYHAERILGVPRVQYPSKHECNTSPYCGSRCAPCWRLVWLSDPNLVSQMADFRKWVEEADYLVAYHCPMPS